MEIPGVPDFALDHEGDPVGVLLEAGLEEGAFGGIVVAELLSMHVT